jgi:lipid-A-disaccharide synthase
MAKQIMIVAGEPSGDALGGHLMAALRERAGDVTFSGVGGLAMAAQGLSSLFPMAELSVMGFAEVAPRVPRLLRRIGETARAARSLRPSALVTIDSPGFNFRLAGRLAGSGIPLIHYVAPQVWAWRPGRARRIAAFLDHLLALLPFEPPYFEAVGLPCTYVGHPAIEAGADRGDGPAFRARHGIAAEATVLLVLAGSRGMEVSRHLSLFGEALNRLAPRIADLHVVSATVPGVAEHVRQAAAAWPVPTLVVEGEGEKYDAFAAADGALAVSGTVVLELALARVPTVVAYRANPVSGWLARRLVTVDYVSLPNLILDRGALPELLLGECRPDRLAAASEEILVDRDARDAQSRAMGEVAAKLEVAGLPPSHRAAETVLAAIERGPRWRR